MVLIYCAMRASCFRASRFSATFPELVSSNSGTSSVTLCLHVGHCILSLLWFPSCQYRMIQALQNRCPHVVVVCSCGSSRQIGHSTFSPYGACTRGGASFSSDVAVGRPALKKMWSTAALMMNGNDARLAMMLAREIPSTSTC